MSRWIEDARLAPVWAVPAGIRGKFRAVNNGFTGIIFLASTFFFFLVSGMDSVVLRTQLAVPEATFISADDFNQLFTTHGTAMMFLFAVPMLEALAIYILPLMIGARDMAYPRMSALTIWTFIFGGLLFYASTLPDIVNFVLPGSPWPDLVPNAGWFSYPPLVNREFSPGLNIDFYLLGLGFAEFAGIAAAVELITTIMKFRAPGMSLDKMPLFAWGVLVMACAILLAFPAVLVGTTFLELERKFGMPFFDPARGGDPLLWQHLFWIFGHPEVYIMFIPATGIVSMIVPALSGRPIAGYVLIATAIAATGFMSFGLWVHHMFATGLPLVTVGLFGAASMMITFPSGVQVFAWLATMINARRVRLDVPMLWVLAFIGTFVLGGITGVMVASVPFDWQTHDTYFVTAHFHYVLVGGVVFPLAAGLTYWWPKITGRLMDERLGRWSFWLVFFGFNLTFLPQHVAGLLGMPRRVYTYEAGLGLEPWNLASTLGTYIMVAGFAIYAANLFGSLKVGRETPADPWGARSLEWWVPGNPPPYNFRKVPRIRARDVLGEPDGVEEWVPERTRPVDPGGRLWRETLVTTALDARPQAIAVVSGPSYMPFALAVTLTIVSAALLFEIYPIALAVSVISVPLVMKWLWPSREERALANAGATLAGADLPAHNAGPASTSWWAMVLTLVSLAAVLGLTVYSYLYLGYARPGPPEVFEAPLRPGVLASVGAALAAAGASYLALRGARRERRPLLLGGLAATAALAAASAGALGLDLVTLGLAPASRAADAMFVTFVGWQVGLGALGASFAVYVLAQAWAGFFDRRRYGAVENTFLYAVFVAGSAVVTVAVAYGTPHLF